MRRRFDAVEGGLDLLVQVLDHGPRGGGVLRKHAFKVGLGRVHGDQGAAFFGGLWTWETSAATHVWV